MPFTPAHPAIVLPFVRHKYVSATALVAGSVAPDFEYFLKMREDDIHGHSLAGLFYFDLPLVFVLSLVFHLLVRNNFIANLPGWLQVRFADVRRVDIIRVIRSRPVVFTLSALFGSGSHLFWDSFTHADGYFVNALWFYEGTVVPYQGARYPLYYALQHFSTYIGMLVVGLFILFRKPDHSFVRSRVSPLYWLALLTVTALVIYIRFIVDVDNSLAVGDVVVSLISAFCLGLIVTGCIPFSKNKAVES
jgi:hypothetical protein